MGTIPSSQATQKNAGARGIIKLVLLGMLMTASILAMSWTYGNGRMSSDSISYLKLAENIKRGEGIWVNDAMSDSGKSLMTERAMGYPILIAAAANLLGLDVFWSAKLINIGLFWLVLAGLYGVWKKLAWIAALVFFTATPLNLWSMTWSEVPYMAGLTAMALAMRKWQQNQNWLNASLIFLGSAWLFGVRYVGAGMVGLIGLMVLWHWRRSEKAAALKLMVVDIGLTLMISTYGWWNWLMTGYIGGRYHEPIAWSNTEKLQWIVRAVLYELDVLIDVPTGAAVWGGSMLIFSLIWLGIAKSGQTKNMKREGCCWPYFFIVGSWQQVLMLLWFWYLGQADARLLGPGMVMLMMGAIDWWMKGKQDKRLAKGLALIAAIAWLVNVPVKLGLAVTRQQANYVEQKTAWLEKYRSVPAGSLIALADGEIQYLRPDLQAIYFSPDSLKEKPARLSLATEQTRKLLVRGCETKPASFYIMVNGKYLKQWQDEEAKFLLASHREGELVKINRCDEILQNGDNKGEK